MMRSLHRSVLRSNKATHKLLKNIEDRKKSTPSRYSMSTLFTSTVLDSISESPPSSTHTVHTAVAVEAAALHTPFPILLVKTRSQIHPDVIGDQNRVQEKSTVILDENNPFNNKYILPNGIAEFQISNVEHSVQTVERNHSKLENELLKREGEGIREGLEQLPGERQRNGEGRGQYLEQGPGEGQRQGRGQYLEQGPGEGQRQGRGQYLEQGPGEGQRQGLEQGEGLGLGQGFKREIVLEQALGEEWGQGHDQREAKGEGDEKDLGWGEGEERQRQLLNASARAVSSDLVSDLQDEGDHLVSDLQDEGDRLVSDLRDEGDHLVSDLRGEGDHLVSDLRDGGVHLVSDLQDEGGHLVSDLQDEGDHLTVAYESASNIRLSECPTKLTSQNFKLNILFYSILFHNKHTRRLSHYTTHSTLPLLSFDFN